jgi:hypothetical protein
MPGKQGRVVGGNVFIRLSNAPRPQSSARSCTRWSEEEWGAVLMSGLNRNGGVPVPMQIVRRTRGVAQGRACGAHDGAGRLDELREQVDTEQLVKADPSGVGEAAKLMGAAGGVGRAVSAFVERRAEGLRRCNCDWSRGPSAEGNIMWT